MSTENIYQLRIQLRDIKPAIWRSVRVPSSITLAKLHKIFQIVMGWTDSHLHEFQIGAARYGVPDPDFDDANSIISEKRAVLGEILTPSMTRFSYSYDFGDGWEHEVRIEQVSSPAADERRLLCVAGVNAD